MKDRTHALLQAIAYVSTGLLGMAATQHTGRWWGIALGLLSGFAVSRYGDTMYRLGRVDERALCTEAILEMKRLAQLQKRHEQPTGER